MKFLYEVKMFVAYRDDIKINKDNAGKNIIFFENKEIFDENCFVAEKTYDSKNGSVYTSSYAFVIKDNDTSRVGGRLLDDTEVIFSHFLFNEKNNKLTDLLTLGVHVLKEEFVKKDIVKPDTFVGVFNKEIKNKRVELNTFGDKDFITANGKVIIEIQNCKLVRINFEEVKEIPELFLFNDKYLQEASFPNVVKVKDWAFFNNEDMKFLNLPKAKYIGNSVLENNKLLTECYLPEAERIGKKFIEGRGSYKKIFVSDKIKSFENVLFKTLSDKSR